MPRIEARRIVASVTNEAAGGDGADVNHVRNAVYGLCFATVVNLPVGMWAALAAMAPDDAFIRLVDVSNSHP
jgi:hypothetical protein